MGKKNGVPKSRKRKRDQRHPCGCYLCIGTDYIEWLKLKFGIKPKHKKDYTEDV